MKSIIIIVGMFFTFLCAAAETTINTKDFNLNVTFNALPTKKVIETSTPEKYYYLGNSERFNLSLTLQKPICKGEVTVENNLNCILPKIENNPGFLKKTFIKKKIPKGIQITYITFVPSGKKHIKVMNSHVLFSHEGNWGDLHASVIKPTQAEMLMLIKLGSEFNYSK